jgi:hypothetical protein
VPRLVESGERLANIYFHEERGDAAHDGSAADL